ncbi:hypothetical protein GXM_05950 [Nostoc sphaeroides CCNUC1]|uniref:Uncharacterized protein n=1 Tax=Nostoc sphaeroides CCNUC1 TaxID=2653204 RepID=A0A5P8W8E6_9NOSO|nr:hypothetical protein GXM_05950 [Nostoc sphaeroides CCNUC1]
MSDRYYLSVSKIIMQIYTPVSTSAFLSWQTIRNLDWYT